MSKALTIYVPELCLGGLKAGFACFFDAQAPGNLATALLGLATYEKLYAGLIYGLIKINSESTFMKMLQCSKFYNFIKEIVPIVPIHGSSACLPQCLCWKQIKIC